MTIARGFRYRLEPSPEQEALFRQFAGVCRLTYNLALEQRATWGREHRLGYVAQAADLTKLRAEFDWVRAVYVSCQQQALRDLDRAFSNVFAGRASFPRPRRRGVDDSFRFPGREIGTRRLNGNWSAVRLPKIGWVKFRDSRPIRGVVKNVTVSRDPLGWHVAFACEIAHDAPAPHPDVVGIDRGVAATLALSTGQMLTLPASLARIEARRRKAQRVLARRKRGSHRRRRAQARVARRASAGATSLHPARVPPPRRAQHRPALRRGRARRPEHARHDRQRGARWLSPAATSARRPG